MKIRCISNSIRLRLRKSDIETLQSQGLVEEKVLFPAAVDSFGFRLSTSDSWKVVWENQTLVILVPKADLDAWILSNQVALNHEWILEDNKILKLLVEKDFPCKHTGDDFEDTFHELQPEDQRMK